MANRLLIRTDGASRDNPGPASAGAVLIDVNPADSELRELALQSPGGVAVAAPASTVLPAISTVAETWARTATPI